MTEKPAKPRETYETLWTPADWPEFMAREQAARDEREEKVRAFARLMSYMPRKVGR